MPIPFFRRRTTTNSRIELLEKRVEYLWDYIQTLEKNLQDRHQLDRWMTDKQIEVKFNAIKEDA